MISISRPNWRRYLPEDDVNRVSKHYPEAEDGDAPALVYEAVSRSVAQVLGQDRCDCQSTDIEDDRDGYCGQEGEYLACPRVIAEEREGCTQGETRGQRPQARTRVDKLEGDPGEVQDVSFPVH